MNARLLPGFALAFIVLTFPRAEGLDAEKWSKVVNQSAGTVTVTVTDTAKVMGSLYIRPAGSEGDGKELGRKGDSYALAPGSYEFYFWTNLAGAIGMHLSFQDNASSKAVKVHVTNLDPTVPGTEFQISADPLDKAGLLFDPSGYRNAGGGTLFTFTGGTR